MSASWDNYLIKCKTRRELLWDLHWNKGTSYNELAQSKEYNPEGRSPQTIQRLVKKIENEKRTQTNEG